MIGELSIRPELPNEEPDKMGLWMTGLYAGDLKTEALRTTGRDNGRARCRIVGLHLTLGAAAWRMTGATMSGDDRRLM